MNVVNVVPMRLSSPPPPPSATEHIPVLRQEVLQLMEPTAGCRYLDATVGAGGHSAALLETDGTEVIATDRDQVALGLARARLEGFGARATLVHARFSELSTKLAELGIERVDGLIADLGLSSMQLGDAGRGMSFRLSGPLDMRMDLERGETALELIARASVDELAEIIFRLGDERRSRRVARCIKQASDAGQLQTTLDLRRAVVQAVGPARHGGVDPATRTFQALRMVVNAELDELQALLEAAAKLVAPGGRVVVISFHSLEDRITKRMLNRPGTWQVLTPKPILPSQQEIDENPRSRSAKLRAARRAELTAVGEH